MQVSQVERFHTAVIEAVAEGSPEAAERIFAKVGRTADSRRPQGFRMAGRDTASAGPRRRGVVMLV
jgi:hypothetical protein